MLLIPAGAAAAQGERPALFVERIDVNVINVEVFVTDGEGRRVAGLTRDDFEIFEDGKPVEMTNFFAVSRPDRILRSLDAAPGAEAGAVAATLRRRDLPEDQALSLLVYVDHFNIRATNRNRVLRDLGYFLEDRMAQGDRVMLMSYNRSLDIVEPFTRDRARVAEGVRRLAKMAAFGDVNEAERRQKMRAMSEAARNGDLPTAYQVLRSHVETVRSELRNTSRALRTVVRSLAGLPGRKALLYVSDGLPQRPGEELYQQLSDLFEFATFQSAGGATQIDPFMETLREDETHLFNDVAREANAHQVTFYGLDARGATGASTGSAEFVGLAAGGSGNTALDRLRTLNAQETLIDLAESTGGATILNTFAFEETLQQLADDFDSFYSLGYRAPQGGDGRFHAIEVKVRQPGLQVRHRMGYIDKPQEERVADRTLSSLILDLEKNPLGVDVQFGRPEKQGRGRYHLPLMVRIPFRSVTLLPNGPVEEGRLRIFLVVKDAKGGISELHEIPYPVSVPADKRTEVLETAIGYAAMLKVRAGEPTVAVGVWDELAGTDSFVHRQIRIDDS